MQVCLHAEAARAVHLVRVPDDPGRRRCRERGGRRRHTSLRPPPGGLISKPAGTFDHRGGHRQTMLDGLEPADRMTELVTLLGVFDRLG